MSGSSDDTGLAASPWETADRIILGRAPSGGVVAVALDGSLEAGRRPLSDTELPAWVAQREADARAAGRGIRGCGRARPCGTRPCSPRACA